MDKKNAYTKIIEKIFFNNYKEGDTEVSFHRREIVGVAKDLKISLPKNIGDIIYTFRYRASLPISIRNKAKKGFVWIIRPSGSSKYKFVVTRFAHVIPNEQLAETKIPNSTPGVIDIYSLSDEQALLAKIRYNRLIDLFTGLTCYSLQSHLRTQVKEIGQVEIDEVYVGIDKKGAHYIVPVQAKGSTDKLGIVQIEQDLSVCKSKFKSLIPKPIGAQFLSDNLIALFEFEESSTGVSIASEKHYRLVEHDQLSEEEIAQYATRTE